MNISLNNKLHFGTAGCYQRMQSRSNQMIVPINEKDMLPNTFDYTAQIKDMINNRYSWAKTYYPETNTVEFSSRVMTDCPSISIDAEGNVVQGIGMVYTKPRTIISNNKALADYVKICRLEYETLKNINNTPVFQSAE